MIGKFLTAWWDDQADLVNVPLYPLTADPDIATYPYATYQIISGSPFSSLNSGHCGLFDRRVQIDLVGRSYADLQAIVTAILGRPGQTGILGFVGDQYGDIHVRRVKLEDQRETIDEPRQGEARGPYRVQLDLMIAHDDVS